MRRCLRLLWPDDWRPDTRTVGLLAFVALTVFSLSGLLQSGQILSIVFTGHPPGIPSAQSALLTPVAIRDRVINGLVFVSFIVGVFAALVALAMATGKTWAARFMITLLTVMLLLLVANAILIPSTTVRIGTNVLSGAGLLALIVVIARTPQPSQSQRPADDPYLLEDDASLRADVEAIFPGATQPLSHE